MNNKSVSWFKMFLTFAPLINAVPSVNVGEGVKAAMDYFKSGNLPPADFPAMSGAVFDMLKDSINQAFTDAEEKSEKARKSINTRWHKDDTAQYDSIQPYTNEYDCIQTNSFYTEKKRREEEQNKMENRTDEIKNTTTTTDSTYRGDSDPDPAAVGGGGGMPQEIINYIRDISRGAKNPAAYYAAVMDRIRKAGYKTLEEVKADRQWNQHQQEPEIHKSFPGVIVV